jgi:hypothetical protein
MIPRSRSKPAGTAVDRRTKIDKPPDTAYESPAPTRMPEHDAGVAATNRIELRIAIILGDVIVEGDDL